MPQLPTTKKNPTTSKLINRHAEIEQIGHILDRIKNCKNVTFEGVNYHGLAGIGKSRLIRHIGSLCREKDIPFALVDFDESPLQSHADYLALLASQLGKYQELFTALQSAAQEQINSAMVKTLQDAVNGKQLSIEEEPFVLIHDSCEYCEPGLFDWIGKEFLECINKLLRRPVVFFLAGRGPHVKMSYWPPELSNKVESYYISAFDIAGTKEHIAALDRNGAFRGVEAEIFALSSGHPYCTETVLYHLQKLNVDVRELPKHRKTLALRLYEEVIRQKLMPDEKVWPHENFAMSCFPRQFDAGLLEMLGGDYHYYWYRARIQDCMHKNIYLVHQKAQSPTYHLDPVLRKLLHTAISNLDLVSAVENNRKLLDIYEKQLRDDTEKGQPDFFTLLEILYHHIQVALLSFQKPLPSVKKLLRAKLKAYFLPTHGGKTIQLQPLGDVLMNDPDFIGILGRKGVEELQEVVKNFSSHCGDEKVCYIGVMFSPPSEYQVFWSGSQDRPLVPRRRFHTSMKFSLEKWRVNPQQVGNLAYDTFFPNALKTFLTARQDHAILLTTDTMDIPFELLHNGKEFLCLSHAFGRQVEMVREPKSVAPIAGKPLRALVIGNPTDDLPSAQVEAEMVADLLEGAGAKVDRLIGKEKAVLFDVVTHLHSKRYHLVHFAGHGFFDEKNPALSALRFSFSEGEGELLRAEEFRRYLKCPTFFFFNACEAASASEHTASYSSQGVFLQNVALGALEAGACGCLGPMWEIPDGDALEFAKHFYTFLLDGKTIGEAVKQSRIKLRTSTGGSDLWASWVLFGNPHRHPFRVAG